MGDIRDESAIFEVVGDENDDDSITEARLPVLNSSSASEMRTNKLQAMNNSWTKGTDRSSLSTCGPMSLSSTVSLPGAVAVRGPDAPNDESSEFLEEESEAFSKLPSSKLVVAAEVVEDDTEDLKIEIAKQRQEMEKLRTKLKKNISSSASRSQLASESKRRKKQEDVALSVLMEDDKCCRLM